MKNLYVRQQAPVNAQLTPAVGIPGNKPLSTDTPTGFQVAKNQKNSNSWRLPKLAVVVMLLLLFATGFNKAQAQVQGFTLSSACTYAAGTYTPSGTQNGKPKYLLNSDQSIYWDGTKWLVDIFDPVTGFSSYILSTNNTPLPPCSGVISAGLLSDISCIGVPFSLNQGCSLVTPNLSIAADSTNVPEITPAKTVVYTVTASSAVATDQKVKITFTGTASASDYTITGLVNDSLTIPANATSATFTLTPVDDAIVESAETVIATMSGPTSGFILGSPVSHTLTIRANDTPAGFTLTSAGGGCTGNFPSSVNFTYDSVFNGHPSYSGTSGFYTVTISFINAKWVFTTINLSSFTLSNQDTPLPPCSGTVSEGMQTNTNTPYNCTGTTFTLNQGCSMPIFTVTTTKQDASCSSASDGWAKATTNQTCGTGYQYLWTPGNYITDSIGGLAAGTYNVRVVCGTDTVNKSVVISAGAGPAAPATTGSLVVYTGNKTISQLDVTPLTGGTVNYYYAATGGTALAGTTVVVDDTMYYVTQTVNGCESNPRKQIRVNRIANDSAVNCNPATVANLITTPVAGDSVKWFSAASGGTPLANTAALSVGANTLYVEEGKSGTDTLARVPGDFAANFNTIVAFDRGENDTLYIGTYKGDIYKANPDGSDTLKIKPGTTQINWITYRKEGADRFLYYTLYAGNDIKKYNLATGAVTTLGTGFFGVRQIDFDDANNRIFIADAERYKVKMLNTLTNTITTIDSFPGSFPVNPLRPFAVKYSASNNKLYYNLFDGTNAKVYARDMSPANLGRTDSVSIGQVNSISILPGGKLLIANSGSIYTSNFDFSNLTIVKTGLYGPNNPFINNNNLLTYTTHTKVVREANLQSNRVPVTVIVNPTPNVVATPDQVVCNNSAVAAVNFSTTTTGGTVTYAWTNNNTNIGLAASGTGNLPSFTGLNNGTAPDTATIIVTPTITNGGVSCMGVKDTFYIVVNPVAVVNPITDKVLCNGGSFTAVIPSNNTTGGTVTYGWTNDLTSIGLAAGGTGNVPAFTAVNNSTAPVTATIIVTPTFTNGGQSCTGVADTFFITVNPTATVNNINNQAVCNSSSTTAVNFSSPATGGSLSYNWTNNNTSIGLGASGSGNITSFTATNSGTAPVTATITVTPIYSNGGVSCTGTPNTFTITVNPTATVNTISNKVVCNGSSVIAVTPTSPTTGGTISYAWTNNTTSIGLAAGGVGSVPAFTASNSGTSPVTATITVTPTFTNGGVSCTGTATIYTVTVNPTATVNIVNNQAVCNGGTSTAVNFNTTATGGAVTYAWTNNNTSIGLAASGSGNISSFTATNSSTAPVTATITVTPTFTNGGASCTGSSQTFTIIVNPTAAVNAVSNQTVCNNSAVSAINFSTASTGGIVTYAWTNNNSSIGLAASGSGNIASFNAINNSNVPVTATIIVTPTFSNGGVSCTGTAQTFTITVNPTAVVNAVSNQTLCAGTTNSVVNFTSPVAGTTYSWTNSNPSIGLAASGSGNVPSFTAVNPSPNSVNATITVTPNIAAGCVGQPITYTITVNDLSVAPTSITNPTPIVCANNAFATLSVNGGALGSGAVWKWYADSLNTVSIGSGATLVNIPVAKTTTYYVRAEGTCNNTAAASIVVQRANLVSHVRHHWADVLLFDNSSRNYVAWQWYKNGVAVSGATLQQYSESSALVGTYYVVANDKNGLQSISCPLTITAGSFTGLRISLFPNPADKGANVTVSTSFTASELQGATLLISDVFGRVVKQFTQVLPVTNIQAPAATGMYIVTLTLQNGMKYSANLLTK